MEEMMGIAQYPLFISLLFDCGLVVQSQGSSIYVLRQYEDARNHRIIEWFGLEGTFKII